MVVDKNNAHRLEKCLVNDCKLVYVIANALKHSLSFFFLTNWLCSAMEKCLYLELLEN